MTKESSIKDYTYKSDLNDDLTSENSLLNQFEFTEALEFDQSYEGVPGENLIFGGMQVKKKKYADDTAGAWLGVDSDKTAKMYLGDATNSMKWDGSAVTIVGGITATTGAIGGWTIGATTITGGSLVLDSANDKILTSATGERVEIDGGGDNLDMINANGDTVVSFNYGTQVTDPILTLQPQTDARIGLQITSAMASDAMRITYSGTGDAMKIDNNSDTDTSGGLEIDRDGSAAGTLLGLIVECDNAGAGTGTGIEVNTDGLGINITNTPAGITISGITGNGIDIDATPTTANTHGINITLNANSTGDGIFINNDANSPLSRGIEIDRDSSTTSPVYGIVMDVANASSGAGVGIDITAKTQGIVATSTPTSSLAVVNLTVPSGSAGHGIKINNDATSDSSHGMNIDRDGSSANELFGLVINANNAGAGTSYGIDIGSDGTGIRIGGTPAVGIECTGATEVFKVALDETAAGAYKGRVPINVNAVTKYFHYYDA